MGLKLMHATSMVCTYSQWLQHPLKNLHAFNDLFIKTSNIFRQKQICVGLGHIVYKFLLPKSRWPNKCDEMNPLGHLSYSETVSFSFLRTACAFILVYFRIAHLFNKTTPIMFCYFHSISTVNTVDNTLCMQ